MKTMVSQAVRSTTLECTPFAGRGTGAGLPWMSEHFWIIGIVSNCCVGELVVLIVSYFACFL